MIVLIVDNNVDIASTSLDGCIGRQQFQAFADFSWIHRNIHVQSHPLGVRSGVDDDVALGWDCVGLPCFDFKCFVQSLS